MSQTNRYQEAVRLIQARTGALVALGGSTQAAKLVISLSRGRRRALMEGTSRNGDTSFAAAVESVTDDLFRLTNQLRGVKGVGTAWPGSARWERAVIEAFQLIDELRQLTR